MLEKITKPYRYSVLGLSLVNLILCLLTYGKRVWYDAYFNRYTYQITYSVQGTYYATVLDATSMGTIFFVLCCLVLLLGIVLLVLKLVKKLDKKVLNITFSGLSLVTGIFGIIAHSTSRNFILEHIVMTKWNGKPGDFVESHFSSSYVLYLILSFSILMIIYSLVELVNCFISKPEHINEGTYTVEL